MNVRASSVVGVLLACGATIEAVTTNWGDLNDPNLWVTIGNPGNPDDIHGYGYGGVDYVYLIGRYEVTNAQYCEFLNAVAVTDTHGLYHEHMGGGWNDIGGIERTGSDGSHVYSVCPARENRPVFFVSFWDACRFANWLHNRQPSGMQDDSTTEDGAYPLNGVTSPENRSITRNAYACVFIPNEHEWYKAAYHKNDGVSSNYWDFPTRRNTWPTNDPPWAQRSGTANFRDPDTSYSVGPPHYVTEVGAYSYSGSPYGTFDQGGNVWEWTESTPTISWRARRGGSYEHWNWFLHANTRDWHYPTFEGRCMGFRVAAIPVILLSVDIKPGSCPNPLNRKSHGVLPVAILGTEDLDVSTIDANSILLIREGVGGGATPAEATIQDVATPFEGELCDCHELGADGILDLLLNFSTQEIVEALDLNSLSPGEEVVLTVTGNLTDGTPFTGSDYVWLVPPVKLKIKHDSKGHVELDPEPVDPNLPEYPLGTGVTLTGVPKLGKSFKHWEICLNPNCPEDANYIAIDVNNPVTIILNGDRLVSASFRCGGGGLGPILGVMLGLFGLHVLVKRKG